MRIAGAIAGGLLLIYLTCGWKIFFPASKRAFMALKNRTAIPAAADYDPAVTLTAMLQPGDDRVRFSPSRAATIEGILVEVFDARPEAANCYAFTRRDTHLEIALVRDAPKRQRVTVEVTPPMREWARRQGLDWSSETLARDYVGRRVRVSGWLLFDQEHDEEAENTRPGDEDNWRATAWEIHPVTGIAVVEDKPGTWIREQGVSGGRLPREPVSP
jgi:hypothetical protein